MKKSTIKNFEKINVIGDFSWSKCRSINEFKFTSVKNKFYEDETILETSIIYVTNNNEYKIIVNFNHIESLKLSIDSKEIQLDIFEIIDIREDGWNSLNYWIRDRQRQELCVNENNLIL
ncbi:hypothetical protein [Paenibacillus sp. IHBB 10380]|uniref:hypothetical protein n=1 Tax=Paenibacillus sp. IHBB 10380 TaxID=1566358 RepID=UPI0005CF9B57|nr:hypothetical protein [Paenibacillus sp. IHBB 10380]AJS58819.1 hypothetical protein UB51_10420 [Paenibacillus sp. IHBB 10380]